MNVIFIAKKTRNQINMAMKYIKKHNLKVSRYKKLTYGYAQEIIAKREQYLFGHRLKNSGDGK